jgi:hypothetical protein
MEETLTVQVVRTALNQIMLHHECEIRRWKDALAAHADEGDYALNAELSIKAAMHQSAWNAVFDAAAVSQVCLEKG